MMKIGQTKLSELLTKVKGPSYDRRATTEGIVHIGVGGFHRSHQAYYLHKLLKLGEGNQWAICGMGLREEDRKIFTVLNQQKGLYSLITRHSNGNIETEIIGSITQFIWAFDTPEKALTKLAHPETKIVSLTITEGGYNFHSDTGEFDFTDPDILHDLDLQNTPKTVFGYLTEAARRRMNAGLPSFTLLSCDNIQHNGDVARKMFLAFALKQDPEVHEWMLANTAFPNSMVDRITPVTTKEDISYLEDTYGISDQWPVTCEPFIQWVVEDHFSQSRPPFEKVGVQLVSDVKPYEKMKLRLLNAGHSVLGIPGALHGHPTIHACMADSVFKFFMRRFMDLEATPTLDPVHGIHLDTYKDTLEARFANTNIKDTVARICSESSAKLPKFLFETIAENLAQNRSILLSSLVVACWFRYHQTRTNELGEPLEIIDARANELKAKSVDPLSFLANSSVFGQLIEQQRFVSSYLNWVKKFENGTRVREMMIQIKDNE